MKVSAPIAGTSTDSPPKLWAPSTWTWMPRSCAASAIRRTGEVNAGDVRDVGNRNHLRVRAEGLDEGDGQIVRSRRRLRNRHPPDGEAVAGRADIPRDVVRRMVLIPEDDLVAAPEHHAGVHDVVRLAGVSHEGQFVGRDSELRCDLLPRRLPQVPELPPVLERAVVVDVPGQLAHPVRHRPRRGTEVRRVHRHLVLFEGELPAHHPEQRLVVGGGGPEGREGGRNGGGGAQERAPGNGIREGLRHGGRLQV